MKTDQKFYPIGTLVQESLRYDRAQADGADLEFGPALFRLVGAERPEQQIIVLGIYHDGDVQCGIGSPDHACDHNFNRIAVGKRLA